MNHMTYADRPPFLVTGICRQLHSNLPAKLARLTSYHEAKPLKLLKLPLKNVGYKKNFHFSIKITPLDLTKIRQHNDCTVVKPNTKSPVKIYKLPIFFQNPTTIIKDLWSSSKYKISINPTKFHCNLFFSKPCLHILQEGNYKYTNSKSKYMLFKYISISYIKFYIIGHKSPTYKDNKMMTPF